jgi:hypothetical protein
MGRFYIYKETKVENKINDDKSFGGYHYIQSRHPTKSTQLLLYKPEEVPRLRMSGPIPPNFPHSFTSLYQSVYTAGIKYKKKGRYERLSLIVEIACRSDVNIYQYKAFVMRGINCAHNIVH